MITVSSFAAVLIFSFFLVKARISYFGISETRTLTFCQFKPWLPIAANVHSSNSAQIWCLPLCDGAVKLGTTLRRYGKKRVSSETSTSQCRDLIAGRRGTADMQAHHTPHTSTFFWRCSNLSTKTQSMARRLGIQPGPCMACSLGIRTQVLPSLLRFFWKASSQSLTVVWTQKLLPFLLQLNTFLWDTPSFLVGNSNNHNGSQDCHRLRKLRPIIYFSTFLWLSIGRPKHQLHRQF